jgi:hypothetical protein
VKLVDSAPELIGKTPILRLHKVTEGTESNVLVKLEFLNTSGRFKDKIALRMIEDLRKLNFLRARYNSRIQLCKYCYCISDGWRGKDKVKISYPQEVRREGMFCGMPIRRKCFVAIKEAKNFDEEKYGYRRCLSRRQMAF